MTARPRTGHTLVELLVGAAVGGLVSAAAVATAARVRSATGREAARAAGRAQLEAAAAVVAAELAGAAAEDLPELRDTVVEVRASLGGGVACAVGAAAGGGSVVSVAAESPGLAWWTTSPRAGDVAAVHDPGASDAAADDAWSERVVRAAAVAGGACAGGAFAAAGDGSWRLELGGAPLPAAVTAGAPVRVLRRRRYSLYRGGDTLWALGLREWDAGGWQGIQPLAGPFDAPSAGGMRVVVRDSSGAVWPGPGAPAGAEVEVVFVASGRWGARAWRDSARAVVRPRGDGGAP